MDLSSETGAPSPSNPYMFCGFFLSQENPRNRNYIKHHQASSSSLIEAVKLKYRFHPHCFATLERFKPIPSHKKHKTTISIQGTVTFSLETEQFGLWHLVHAKHTEDKMAGVFLSLAWVTWNIYLWCLWKWSKRDLESPWMGKESDGLRSWNQSEPIGLQSKWLLQAENMPPWNTPQKDGLMKVKIV